MSTVAPVAGSNPTYALIKAQTANVAKPKESAAEEAGETKAQEAAEGSSGNVDVKG
jgi:hypothetical protein